MKFLAFCFVVSFLFAMLVGGAFKRPVVDNIPGPEYSVDKTEQRQ